MGFAMGSVRYILFFFNFLLALAGLGIFVLGILTAHSKGATLNEIVHGQLTTPAIVFSIVGACVFVFAFFGCCGALRESHCMICTYAVLLLTLILLQAAVAVLAYTYKGQAKDLITQGLQKSFESYKNDSNSRQLVDNVQQQLQCCGSLNSQTPWSSLGISTPVSCFPGNDTSKTQFNTGCIPLMTSMVEESLSDITKVAVSVAVVQVVAFVFALFLANSIRRSELRGYS